MIIRALWRQVKSHSSNNISGGSHRSIDNGGFDRVQDFDRSVNGVDGLTLVDIHDSIDKVRTIVNIATHDIEADKVDTKPLHKFQDGAAGEFDCSPIPLELYNGVLAHKIFDTDDGHLDITVLEWDVQFRVVIELVSNHDLTSVGNVAARCIAVCNSIPRSDARPHCVARE